ncbi:uncharacterized protein LOC135689272 [Rhopilema esculentum]|uniref:uncharacterized protein LOC135689272 n=1 Tax=Rhopilema esculentum TaxID=499914 RepID=UPI0031D51FD2
MTDTSSEVGKKLVSEALQNNPSLTRRQVKDWINNYKKKLSGKKRKRSKQSNSSIRKRKRTARDIFQEEFLKQNHGSMRGLEEEWSRVKRDKTALCALETEAEERNAGTVLLTNSEKEQKAMKIRKEMQNLATELSNIGFECFGMIAKPNSNLCGQFGTQRGKEFLNGSNLYWEFLSQINVNKNDKSTIEWENLRSAVQEKMNQAYRDSGMKSKRVEWRKIKEGDVLAYGFPENLNPAPASSYGKESLRRLLDENVVFSFQRAAVDIPEGMEPPFKILESSSNQNADFFDTDTNMAIQNEDEVEQMAASVDLSDPAHLKNLVTSLQEATPVLENSEVYPVECLLGKKVRKKVTHYLVKWKGFENPTWEPHHNIPKEIKLAYKNSKK